MTLNQLTARLAKLVEDFEDTAQTDRWYADTHILTEIIRTTAELHTALVDYEARPAQVEPEPTTHLIPDNAGDKFDFHNQ